MCMFTTINLKKSPKSSLNVYTRNQNVTKSSFRAAMIIAYCAISKKIKKGGSFVERGWLSF
jgi:hypothetical protein